MRQSGLVRRAAAFAGGSGFDALFAISTLMLLPLFVLFLLFQRLLIDGIATTGLTD